MKISQIYKILDEVAPFDTQESWDNSALLIGSNSDEFNKIYVSLDADSDLIDQLEENSLLITHHPLIFKGLKRLNGKYPSNLINKMIKKDIKLISLHTNFDLSVLNRYFVQNVLNFEIQKIQDFIIYVNIDMSFDELADLVKVKLGIEHLRVCKAKQRVKTLAICTGSASEFASNLQVDCFLTGDIKYHTALECLENGLSLIDIEHFYSEKCFGICLKDELKNKGIEVIIKNSKNPFSYI